MNTVIKILSLLVLVGIVSCEKCEKCSAAHYSAKERSIMYASHDTLRFVHDTDTLLAPVESNITEVENEDCATFPLTSSCMSRGQVSIYYSPPGYASTSLLHRVDSQKDKTGWTCTSFEVGNAFYFSMDTQYQLSDVNNNDYMLNTLSGYEYDEASYDKVQEITKPPIGNPYELIRIVYHPQVGLLELGYTNPTITYKRIP